MLKKKKPARDKKSAEKLKKFQKVKERACCTWEDITITPILSGFRFPGSLSPQTPHPTISHSNNLLQGKTYRRHNKKQKNKKQNKKTKKQKTEQKKKAVIHSNLATYRMRRTRLRIFGGGGKEEAKPFSLCFFFFLSLFSHHS